MEAMRQSWTDDRMDDLVKRVDDGFLRVDERFEQVKRRSNEIFAQINQRLEQLHGDNRELQRRFDTLFITILAVVLTSFGGFLVALLT